MIWQPIDMATIGILRIYRNGPMVLGDTKEVTYTAAPAWLTPLAPTGIPFRRNDLMTCC